MTIFLVICIGYVVVASLLIHGARKGRPDLLMPWIILTVITLILNWGQLIRHIVNAEYVYLVSDLFVIAIENYFLNVVWAFRKQLQENMGGGGAAYNQPQQPPGYQFQQASGGGYPPQQPGGYQAPPGGFQSPPAGYYPPPEQQQMVPPGYPAQPPPYPGPPQGGFPTNNQEPFATKQAPYNPNAP